MLCEFTVGLSWIVYIGAAFTHEKPTLTNSGWKHFEAGCSYVLRGLIIHKLLPSVWRTCQADTADDLNTLMAAAMDADNADANPAVRQKLRVQKVAELLEGETATVALLQHVLCHAQVPANDVLLQIALAWLHDQHV